MKNVNIFSFYGYQGVIRGPIESNNEILADKPLLEVDIDFMGAILGCESSPIELSPPAIADLFRSDYKAWGRFGYMGDILTVKMVKTGDVYTYFLDYIGRLAIIKPGLAVDLIPIIKVGFDDYYFVGIKRKYNPGQGLPALMGGFVDVNGYHLDTPIETIIHEAQEEIGLELKVVNQGDLSNPLPGRVAINVDYQGKPFQGELIFRAILPTGDNEKLPHLGLKRVYQTTAYALLLDMTQAYLGEEGIRKWLQAGDDADELVVINLKEGQNLKFGLAHHKVIFDDLLVYLSTHSF